LAHLGLLLLLGYGHYIEPFWLDVTHTEIKTAPADSSVEPLKVVLISDIHMERWTRREDDALAKINALEPDLLFVSGDHINLDYVKPETYSDIRRFFIGLKARYGIYAVGGTVDDIKETREALSGLAVVFLNDEIARLNVKGREIEVLGIRSDYMDDERILREMSPRLNPAALKILLYHTPDLAPVAAETGINLYLAGHTHGGQVALPFFGAVFTASKYGRKYASGLYNLGGANQTKMYVTRGLGFEGYNTIRMRLFARPEITALNLQ
jgi:predicted MPP superfamily phosphohydrolase